MKTFIKSIQSLKVTLSIRTLLACLVVVAISFAAIPTWAGGADDKAKKASADWKAAKQAVAAAQEKLADAQKTLQNAMTVIAKSGGKTTPEQEAALAKGRAEVAAAAAALRETEKQELAARVALENAIAELPDGELKDQLKRERNFPTLVTANGLNTVTFNTAPGRITVNLPDDIRAGDTISGTVFTEPKGNTTEEKAKNQSVLNGLGIKIDGKRVEPFSGDPEKERESTIQQTFWIYTATLSGRGSTVPIAVADRDGKTLAQTSILIGQMFDEIGRVTPPTHPSGAVITPDPKITPPTHPSGAVITPDPKITNPPFSFPLLGQTGRPIVVTGPFDGNSSNTTVRVGDWEDRENTGRLDVIAESPRKAVVNAPTNVTGPIKLRLTEGNTRSTGSYRNVGVNLTAPKTNLLKGEKTELRVEVSGLEGIKEPVPLTLESRGVITMEGGTNQPLVIQPSQVSADGRYSTTRGITGVQAGGWGATATVVTNRSGMGAGGNMLARPPMLTLYDNEQDMTGIKSVEDLKEALKKQGLQDKHEDTCKRLIDTKTALCTRYKNTSTGDTQGRTDLETWYQIVRQVSIDNLCGHTLPATLAGC